MGEIKDAQTKELAKVLKDAKGNISEAARKLGVAKSTLVHRLRKYGLI